jgi:hypothetical protein
MSVITHATHLGLVAVMLAVSVAAATETRMYKGYETPPYAVLQSDGPIELRRYAPHVVAEVSVEGSRRGAVGRGFRTLAKYIFGGNAEETKVAMTAPVAQMPMAERTGAWDVQFMMPSAYGIESLPKPTDAAIRFTMTEPQEQAVIRFSGFWTDRVLRDKSQALRVWAEARGLQVVGDARYYFYDDPFTLPFNRRNEVAFVIR